MKNTTLEEPNPGMEPGSPEREAVSVTTETPLGNIYNNTYFDQVFF